MSAGIDIDRVHSPAIAPADQRRRRTDVEEADAARELSPLTPKQREVLILTCKGYSLNEVARLLDMGLSTVTAHRGAITQALDMSLIEAAVLCVRARWV